MARKPLGRGLSALLGEEKVENLGNHSVNEVDIDLIEPNPEQPRTRFVDKALDELATSITANGVVQPIVVREKEGRFQIIAGERRWRASQRAGLRRVPVVVRDVSDDKLLEIALIENIQRQELNPVEEANAYRKLIDNIGLTQEQVAERVGKERTLITTLLRLLKLPDDIQALIEEKKLTAGHGRALLMCTDPSVQRKVAQEIIDGSMSVREAERAVKKAMKSPQIADNKRVIKTVDPNMKAAETKLMRRLNTNVKILDRSEGKGGKIEIEYYGNSDLDRIFQLIMGS
ncbi:MAG: ParB/RepB/Spo0J family partition protein [Acidobacteria bacterium]|nr:ParB/RepB/Spo0J family partition protein [Acidobacteriota bacterium]